MNDYIDRQAAIEAINRAVTKEVARWSVKELPSAEVEPVKHGRWEWRNEKTLWQTGYYCSECQAFFGKDYDMVKYFNYCPNCGAYMRGEKNERD